jgi:hypothetical protein
MEFNMSQNTAAYWNRETKHESNRKAVKTDHQNQIVQNGGTAEK